MAWFGPQALGSRKNAKRVIPRKVRVQGRKKKERKYAPKGKPHKHRCPDCTFLWPCSVAMCKMKDLHICPDCDPGGTFSVVRRKNEPLIGVPAPHREVPDRDEFGEQREIDRDESENDMSGVQDEESEGVIEDD